MVGVGVGLLEDIFFGTSVGYFTLLFMLTGYLAGRSHKDFYRENYLMPIILSFIAVFLYQTAIYVTSFLFRGELNFWYFLSKFILPEAVYTAIFSVLVYRILFAINDTLELKEKYKYRLF